MGNPFWGDPHASWIFHPAYLIEFSVDGRPKLCISISVMYPYPGLHVSECHRLIVVDTQKQFLNSNTESVVSGIDAMMPHFQRVVASQIELDPNSMFFRLKKWAPAKVGSTGHELAIKTDGLLQNQFHVTRKSFISAYTEDAATFLAAKPGETIHICGMDTDMCVLQTGIDVMRAGMRPVILKDLCMSFAGSSMHEHAVIQCKRFFGRDQVL
ncbi:cysteine hydrolase family protein [Rubellicoccus peritrichatus]|uniref:Isochorismatase family protein n=1 Tax=Rubellicoccus peritrichatus TaxID=3080537 RepID=A0AAQ3LBW3_9BACT|nr:isochorismatase family protein [Puniceicoccus sp. CR14]WOO40648.1 isochorismatase family protein [Puniceicoccus sp. CR14]